MSNLTSHLKHIKWWQATALLAVVSSAYFAALFFSRASFSSSDVQLFISGPENFKSQEKVEFELKLKNKSQFNLQGAVYVTLPDFLVFDGVGTNEQRIELGKLAKAGEFAKKISIFAKETQKQGEIKVRAEYAPEGISGRFEGLANMHVEVASLPLTVIFDLPQKAVDGQILRGNFYFVAERDLEALPLLARLILPEDFTLKDAEPAPQDTTTWEFGGVEPGTNYRVDFEGPIKGYESENKRFDLVFGIKDFGIKDGDFGFLEQYRVSREVKISSAPIEFNETINGVSDYVASAGEELKFNISYKNKSGVDIEDAVVTAELLGDVFDFSTLNTGFGYFNESAKTIIWNKEFAAQLARLDKDVSGSVDFSVSLKKNIAIKDYRDKNIVIKSRAVIDSPKPPLALKGLSLRAEDVAEVKLRTSLELSSAAYYYEGPFSNTGPIPPRVAEKTTYTIAWKAANTLNEVKDAIVETLLPKNVFFEQKVYPAASNLIYNSQTHSVIWNIGTLKPGTGSFIPTATVTFGISIIPQETQRGLPAELLEQATFTGRDTFTNELVKYLAPPLDTSLPQDQGMREGDGIVE